MKFLHTPRRRATIAISVVAGLLATGGIITTTAQTANASDHTHCYHVEARGDYHLKTTCFGDEHDLTEREAVQKRMQYGFEIVDSSVAARTAYVHGCYDEKDLSRKVLGGLGVCPGKNFEATQPEISAIRTLRDRTVAQSKNVKPNAKLGPAGGATANSSQCTKSNQKVKVSALNNKTVNYVNCLTYANSLVFAGEKTADKKSSQPSSTEAGRKDIGKKAGSGNSVQTYVCQKELKSSKVNFGYYDYKPPTNHVPKGVNINGWYLLTSAKDSKGKTAWGWVYSNDINAPKASKEQGAKVSGVPTCDTVAPATAASSGESTPTGNSSGACTVHHYADSHPTSSITDTGLNKKITFIYYCNTPKPATTYSDAAATKASGKLIEASNWISCLASPTVGRTLGDSGGWGYVKVKDAFGKTFNGKAADANGKAVTIPTCSSLK